MNIYLVGTFLVATLLQTCNEYNIHLQNTFIQTPLKVQKSKKQLNINNPLVNIRVIQICVINSKPCLNTSKTFGVLLNQRIAKQ
jgi:hypothetical protein